MNLHRFTHLTFLCCAILILCLNSVQAQSKAVDKNALISIWEKGLAANPTTHTLKKIDDTPQYDFETSMFPYKGRIKVLNVVVSSSPELYDFRGSDYDTLYNMVTQQAFIEVKLLDAPEKFFADMSQSYSAWQKANALYFIAKENKWVNGNGLLELISSQNNTTNTSKTTPNSSEQPTSFLSRLNMYDIIGYCTLGFFGYAFVAIIIQRPKRKKYWDFLNTSENTTRKSLENQEIMIGLLKELVDKKHADDNRS
jgi:hypothetical protein